MALSCVYRTGQRFGAGHVIDVLRGSNNEKINTFEHQTLSTYGIGKHLSGDEWKSIFRQLVARGLLDVDVQGFGSLLLNESCRELLRGEESIQLRRELKTTASSIARKQGVVVDAEDQALWNALRSCRKRLAEEQGVPPYVIFGDVALVEMSRERPSTEDEFLEINGVGQVKLERHGAVFLEAIACDEA